MENIYYEKSHIYKLKNGKIYNSECNKINKKLRYVLYSCNKDTKKCKQAKDQNIIPDIYCNYLRDSNLSQIKNIIENVAKLLERKINLPNAKYDDKSKWSKFENLSHISNINDYYNNRLGMIRNFCIWIYKHNNACNIHGPEKTRDTFNIFGYDWYVFLNTKGSKWNISEKNIYTLFNHDFQHHNKQYTYHMIYWLSMYSLCTHKYYINSFHKLSKSLIGGYLLFNIIDNLDKSLATIVKYICIYLNEGLKRNSEYKNNNYAFKTFKIKNFYDNIKIDYLLFVDDLHTILK